MLTLSPTAASSNSTAYDRVDATEASRSAVSARSASKAIELSNATMGDRATGIKTTPGVMDGLSTVAVGAALSSIPAALGRMRDITVASSSGTLSDADLATLQVEYSQLRRQLSSVVGSASASGGTSTASDKSADDGSAKNKTDDGSSPRSADTKSPVNQAVRRQDAGKAAASTAPGATVSSGTSRPRSAAHVASAAAAEHVGGADTTVSRPAAIAQFQQHFATQKALISLVA